MTQNNKPSIISVSSVKESLEITKNIGYLLFCLMIIISGLMMFGASFKYHFLFNLTSGEMIYFLLQSGFYIVIVFTVLCYLLSPMGYLVYYLLFKIFFKVRLIGEYIIENIKLCRENKELLNWCSYLDSNKTIDNNDELLKINEIIKRHHYVLFSLLLIIVFIFVYSTFTIIHNKDFLFACFSICLVFPSIKIVINRQYKLDLVIVVCIFVCIHGLFFSNTGYYFFENYLSITNGLKHNPVIVLDNDCTLKNRPIFNQYDPQIINIVTNKSESTSFGYRSVESAYFNNHSQIFSQFLESFSILRSESNVKYINFYSNKLIYLENKDKTIDLSGCVTVKVLN